MTGSFRIYNGRLERVDTIFPVEHFARPLSSKKIEQMALSPPALASLYPPLRSNTHHLSFVDDDTDTSSADSFRFEFGDSFLPPDGVAVKSPPSPAPCTPPSKKRKASANEPEKSRSVVSPDTNKKSAKSTSRSPPKAPKKKHRADDDDGPYVPLAPKDRRLSHPTPSFPLFNVMSVPPALLAAAQKATGDSSGDDCADCAHSSDLSDRLQRIEDQQRRILQLLTSAYAVLPSGDTLA